MAVVNTLAYLDVAIIISVKSFQGQVLGRYYRERLLKGKNRYRLPPCADYFRSTAFHVETIFFFFMRQASLMRSQEY
jgi:hypothetical protein